MISRDLKVKPFVTGGRDLFRRAFPALRSGTFKNLAALHECLRRFLRSVMRSTVFKGQICNQ